MGFGEAYINIQLLTQSILDYPMLYDIFKGKLVENPKLTSKRKRMYRWYIGNIFIASVHLFSIYHLNLLMKAFDMRTSSKYLKEQVFIYIFTISITAQALITWYTVERNPSFFGQVESEIFWAFGYKNKGWPAGRKSIHAGDIISYGLSACFFLFPFSAVALPIIRPYDPINTMFLTFCPFQVAPTVRLVIVIILYLWSVTFGALSCLNILLLMMSHCYAMTQMSRANVKVSANYVRSCPSIRYSKAMTGSTSMVLFDFNLLSSREIQNLRKVFHKRLHLYLQLRIMLQSSNSALHMYKPVIVGIAITLCTVANYGVIQFGFGPNRLPIPMIACAVFTSSGLSTLTLFLLLYASGPLTGTEELIIFWRRLKLGKIEHRLLKAMIPVGLCMGPYFKIKRTTAMDVLESILNYTINALMSEKI